ncbi:MAG: metallophosphoesterase family protein [Nanobdellota archaeon]
MRILAFGDTHGSSRQLKRLTKKAEGCDMILCLGDFTIFGNEQRKILRKINKMGKVFLIHGNHELSSEVIKDIKDLKNIKNLHKKGIIYKNTLFLGWGGDGFSLEDERFRTLEKVFLKKKDKAEKTILMTHGPAYGTDIDLINDEHCGNKTYREFLDKYKPDIMLSGHLHENNGVEQELGKTRIINPGPEGKIIDI